MKAHAGRDPPDRDRRKRYRELGARNTERRRFPHKSAWSVKRYNVIREREEAEGNGRGGRAREVRGELLGAARWMCINQRTRRCANTRSAAKTPDKHSFSNNKRMLILIRLAPGDSDGAEQTAR